MKGAAMQKDLLRTSDLAAADLAQLLDAAQAFRADPHRGHTTLRGESVVLYFNKPSTRTRISFETAVARLGGTPISVGASDLQIGRGETLEDTARTLSRYARALVVRTYADEDVRHLARAASIPVVNALTDGHHPCQSVADLLTLRDRLGRLRGLKVAYVGAGNNVAHSLIEASALAGIHVAVAAPRRAAPDPEVVEWARHAAQANGGSVTLTEDPEEAVEGAHAVYTDTWSSMGDPEGERAARVEALRPYRVDAALLARARPDAIFLHCLPAHRGEEVAAEVIDGPRSVVFDQAENRLHTAVAILHALVRGELGGAP
jgi:ornithine carbamoyltransferase